MNFDVFDASFLCQYHVSCVVFRLVRHVVRRVVCRVSWVVRAKNCFTYIVRRRRLLALLACRSPHPAPPPRPRLRVSCVVRRVVCRISSVVWIPCLVFRFCVMRRVVSRVSFIAKAKHCFL